MLYQLRAIYTLHVTLSVTDYFNMKNTYGQEDLVRNNLLQGMALSTSHKDPDPHSLDLGLLSDQKPNLLRTPHETFRLTEH